MEPFEITLPMPPSVNNSYGVRKGAFFKNKKYLAWDADCDEILAKLPRPLPLFKNKVKLSYVYYFKKKGSDIDNRVKATTDFLVRAGFLINDSFDHVLQDDIRFGGIDKYDPRVEIKIELIP